MDDCLIGVDAGGTMVKAALFDARGNELACERRPQRMQFPAAGHTERDADQMWQSAAETIRAVLERTNTPASRIAGISTTGYGSGLYVVDPQGNPLRPGIVSTDSRAASIVQAWQDDGRAALIEPQIRQRIWAGQSTMLMAWLAEHEADVVARSHSVLFCKDFLRARLCNEVSTDPSDAGISGLFDIRAGRYVEESFGDLGMTAWRGKLPMVKPALAIAAGVSAEAARQTGLLAGTPVVRGILDVAASSIASGVMSPSQLNIIAGTFSINQTLHHTPRFSIPPFLQCPYPVGGMFLATEGGATSASNLEWFCKSLLGAEAERARNAGMSIYEVCNELVAATPIDASKVLFFPFIFGGPNGIPAGLFGMKASDQLGEMMRAVYEGIVFAHALDIDRLLAGSDAARPEVVRLAGGAAQSAVWAQMFADVLGLPVEVTACSESGALGATLCTAVALGIYPDLDAAVAAMVRVRRRFEPRPDMHEAYARKYTYYQRVMRTLAELPQD